MENPEFEVASLIFQWLRGRVAIVGDNESGRALKSAFFGGQMMVARVLATLLDPDEKDLLLLYHACIELHGRAAETLIVGDLPVHEVDIAKHKQKFRAEWRSVFEVLDEFIVRVGEQCNDLSYSEFVRRATGVHKSKLG